MEKPRGPMMSRRGVLGAAALLTVGSLLSTPTPTPARERRKAHYIVPEPSEEHKEKLGIFIEKVEKWRSALSDTNSYERKMLAGADYAEAAQVVRAAARDITDGYFALHGHYRLDTFLPSHLTPGHHVVRWSQNDEKKKGYANAFRVRVFDDTHHKWRVVQITARHVVESLKLEDQTSYGSWAKSAECDGAAQFDDTFHGNVMDLPEYKPDLVLNLPPEGCMVVIYGHDIDQPDTKGDIFKILGKKEPPVKSFASVVLGDASETQGCHVDMSSAYGPGSLLIPLPDAEVSGVDRRTDPDRPLAAQGLSGSAVYMRIPLETDSQGNVKYDFMPCSAFTGVFDILQTAVTGADGFTTHKAVGTIADPRGVAHLVKSLFAEKTGKSVSLRRG